MKKELLFSGIGGQGVITLGETDVYKRQAYNSLKSVLEENNCL